MSKVLAPFLLAKTEMFSEFAATLVDVDVLSVFTAANLRVALVLVALRTPTKPVENADATVITPLKFALLVTAGVGARRMALADSLSAGNRAPIRLLAAI